ncbi:MAG TPA: flagellar basal-body MS-ring/collar protein FliF [Actinophytocola sp.]|uniref:flagellar basal-body MS-ring/collar protein FliF n=1 Tax=Actinophytocola sp. TaxID=1872138 RepID=UPI002DB6E08E|nr:flagellar basal-body MS-ring/collar protein FliF [Actinophytocola sp.]HEU5474210.1 flagellar basal-body MS-ring/collar protein FliF [Actinophytocola sp.]
MNLDRFLVLGRRVVGGFKAFSLGQKIVVTASVLAIVAGVVAFIAWSSKPDYAPLFSNLAAKDAGAIVEKLDSAGTSYELTDGGQTIMVPKDQVYQLRLQMSSAGLPADSDTGYALLDQQGVTTSEFMQQVGYQRALEGELTKTIKSIDGVANATVHLAIPKKDVFSDEASKPTAAVMVQSNGSKQLAPEQVQAVVNLVASSVEGLNPDDVTVANSDGTVLAAPGQTGAGATSGHEQQTQAFEQRMSTSVQQMLTQVVGAEHAVVKVTADLDFDQVESKSQIYTSDPNAEPLSESNTNETYNGNGTANGGLLGQINGITGGSTGNGNYQQEKSVRDNAVNSVIESRKSAPGKVRKLGVAVLLDSTTAGTVDMGAIENLASSAVGLDSTRGDTIAVSRMPFDQSAAEANQQELAAAQAAENEDQLYSLIKTGIVAAGVLVLLLITWIAARRRRKRNAVNRAELRKLEELKAELERSRIAEEIKAAEHQAKLISTGGPVAELPAGPVEPDNGPEEHKLKEIEALVDDQPDEVARLLRSWLTTTGA